MRRIQYSDRTAVAANQNIKEKTYWLETLGGELIKNHFPYDRKGFGNEALQDCTMKKETLEFPQMLLLMLKKLSSGIDLKLHIILTAGLVGLLDKYTAAGDIIIGSPILKQDKKADFINTILVFRTQLSHQMTVRDLLLQVKGTIINATKHQNFPLEVLPDLLNLPLPVNSDEFPLFDVALLLENIHDRTYLKGIHCSMFFSFRCTDDGIEGSLKYNSLLYHERTIKQIINHYTRFLEKGLSDLSMRLEDIDILSKEERHRLLEEFNANTVEFPNDKTFCALFEEQVEKTPEQIALLGQIPNPKSQIPNKVATPDYYNISITYKELNEKSDQLARLLKRKGMQPDNIVGIMMARCVEMIIAVLAVMKAGGAYLPIDADYPEERINYMLADSRARILVSNVSKVSGWDGEILHTPAASQPPLPGGVPEGRGGSEPAARSPQLAASLAYVIYTSGSTGKPKGVMVQHNHLVNAAMGWRKEYRLQEIEVILLQMVSFSFDVFAGDLARTFINGGKMVINPVMAIDPESLYQLIDTHRVTLFESTPSYIIPFMRYVHDNDLPIDSLRLLILGSDSCPVRDFKALLTHFSKQMRIINSYGVTEATIDSSYYEEYKEEHIPFVANVPIGKPLPNVNFYIPDPWGHFLPVGVPGELCIGGAGITRGYLNNPELTAERFLNSPRITRISTKKVNKTNKKVPGKRIYHMSYMSHMSYIYKTGDLGRWLSDGNVEFLGRMDYQVKVRGYRIELGEIESKLLEHEDINEAVVVEKTGEGDDKYLCGYIISGKALEAAQLREYLGQKLPDYMVPWFFVQMDQFPLTPNGKIDRKALPDPETVREVEYAAPRSKTERQLVDIWARVLSVNKETLGIDNRFFDLGGNSLKAIMMISKIHKTFDVKVSLADMFNIQTIRGISQLIKKTSEYKFIHIEPTEDNFIPVEPAETKEYYALSPAQKRLYVLQQMDPEGTAYNMPEVVILQGDPEKAKSEDIFKKLIKRYESLRTTFEIIEGEPVQKVHHYADVDFEIERLAVRGAAPIKQAARNSQPVTSTIKDFIRPFDLSQPPLLRVGLIKLSEKNALIVDMHHIISDAASHEILVKDFKSLHKGKELPALRLQYKDYSQWQNSERHLAVRQRQEDYWLKTFPGKLPVLNLPFDYPRPPVQSFEGDIYYFKVAGEETGSLRKLASKQGATMQMVLLAIFYILLARISGQEDIIIGTSVIGRRHPDLENIPGVFTNTLALRNHPSGEKTFLEFLKEVKESSLNSYENQDYPFEDLVKKVALDRDMSRNPLFDIMFEIRENLEKDAGPPEQPGREFDLPAYQQGNITTKFDQDWMGFESEQGLSFSVTYCSKLFARESIELMADEFLTLIGNVINNTQSRIKDLDYTASIEKELNKVERIKFKF